MKRDHEMWTQDPHLAGNMGLSRFYDLGEGPAMEALQDENDVYRHVAGYFLFHPVAPPLVREESEVPSSRALGAPYSVRVCSIGQPPSSCESEQRVRLEPDYYKGDRSMRESGFDISFRFGPFWRLHSSLCARLSELAAFQNRARPGNNEPTTGQEHGRGALASCSGVAQGGTAKIPVG